MEDTNGSGTGDGENVTLLLHLY